MFTDVLFETKVLADKTCPLLKKEGLLQDIRFIICPERPGDTDIRKFMLLSPYTLRAEYEERYINIINREKPERILVRNIEELGLLRDTGFKGEIMADASLYSFNRESREVLKSFGVSFDTAPFELNLHELKTRGLSASSLVVYGRTPLMISAQCTEKTASGKCRKTKGGYSGSLKDRKKTVFPVRAECDYCYNVIYNSVPLSLHREMDEVKKLDPSAIRIDLSDERAEDAVEIIRGFCHSDVQGLNSVIPEYTKGHFRKGVE